MQCPILLSIMYLIKEEKGSYVQDLVDGWVGTLRTRGAMVGRLPCKSRQGEGEDSDSDDEEEDGDGDGEDNNNNNNEDEEEG